MSLLHLQMRPGRARAGGGPAERDWRYCLREGSGARKATGHPLEGHPSVDAEKRWAAPELCFRGLGWNRADFSHPDVLASLDECGVGHLLFVEAPPGVQWHRRFPGLGPPRLMEGQATWPQLRAGLEGGEALSAARFAQGSWKAKCVGAAPPARRGGAKGKGADGPRLAGTASSTASGSTASRPRAGASGSTGRRSSRRTGSGCRRRWRAS